MRMPFGKHKGIPLSELPKDYLQWLARLDDLREPLASAIAAELRARSTKSNSSPNSSDTVTVAIDKDDVSTARELIQLGRRTAALRHHPDAGGDPQKMVEVNTTADKLLEALGTP